MKPSKGNNMSSRWRAPTLDCEKKKSKMNEYEWILSWVKKLLAIPSLQASIHLLSLNGVFKSCHAEIIARRVCVKKGLKIALFLQDCLLKWNRVQSQRFVFLGLSSIIRQSVLRPPSEWHLKVKYRGKWVWSESKNPGNIMHMREKMKFVWMTGRATFSPIDFILSKWKIGSVWEAH